MGVLPGTWATEVNRPICLALRRTLWRYAVSERVSMEIGVITQARPGAVLFRCVCDAVFFTLCEVVPRIVPGDGEERPIGAFQVLHQHVSSSRIAWRARYFA